MPLIYPRATGVLKTPELTITKSTGTLIFEMSKAVKDLTNEKITLWIERPGSQNVYLATKVDLKTFIYACLTSQQTTILDGFGNGNIVVCDFGFDGALKLMDGEKIKIQLEGLIATDYYEISYAEHFIESTAYVGFEQKSILDGETDKQYTVADYEVAIIKKDANLNEIGITYSGAGEKRYTPKELQVLLMEDKPVFRNVAGLVSAQDENYICMPLIGVTALRFYKNSAGVVPVVLMKMGELAPAASYALTSLPRR